MPLCQVHSYGDFLQGLLKKTKKIESPINLSGHRLKFLIAYLLPFTFILCYYALAYARYPSISLPVGWDTPWYINAINLAKTGDFFGLLQVSYYTNFLYPLLVSFIPLSAFEIETYVPILLNLLLPVIVYNFVKRTSKYNAYIAMASTCAWFVTYRLAGLNSNLFSIIFCLLAASLFLESSKLTKKRAVSIIALVVISSLVGFEVTFFFAVITLLALAASRTGTKSKYLLLITGLLPSSLLYVYSKLDRLQTEGGLATGSGATAFDIFLYSFGFYMIPLVIWGAYFILAKKNRNLYDYFVLSWTLPTLLLVGLNFFLPLRNFAERALVLFPSIFAALPLIDEINRKRALLKERLFRPLIGIAITTLVITAYFTASFSYDNYPKQFLSKDIYDELEFLKGYVKLTNSSIIILYNANSGMVEFYSNWAQAIVGNIPQYFGSISDLLSLNKGYNNAISRRLYSQGGFEKMNFTTLINYKLFIIQQFYVGDIPTSLQQAASQVHKGVKIVDLKNLSTTPNFTASVFSLWGNTGYGSWYYNQEMEALGIYSNDTQNPYVFLNLSLPVAGSYNVTLQYWDGSNNLGLKMFINDNIGHEIQYNSANNFTEYSILNVYLNSTNTLRIEALRATTKSMYFARLKSITISPNPWQGK